MTRLSTRVERLEASGDTGHRPHCWVIAEDDESSEQAVARHKADEGCIENSGGHVVWVTI